MTEETNLETQKWCTTKCTNVQKSGNSVVCVQALFALDRDIMKQEPVLLYRYFGIRLMSTEKNGVDTWNV